MMIKILKNPRYYLTIPIVRVVARHRFTCWLAIDFNRQGIDFPYYGDWVIWLWPWSKNRTHRYVSICCEGGFNSLSEIRAFWDEFNKVNDAYLDKLNVDKSSQSNHTC